MLYYGIVILSVFAAACAQMLLKKAADTSYPSIWRQYFNPWVIGGYGIMGLTILVNVFAMAHGIQLKEVSIFESLSYLFVPALSYLFFRERLTWRKIVAIVVIMTGIVVFFL